jgi:hypothetical protein
MADKNVSPVEEQEILTLFDRVWERLAEVNSAYAVDKVTADVEAARQESRSAPAGDGQLNPMNRGRSIIRLCPYYFPTPARKPKKS